MCKRAAFRASGIWSKCLVTEQMWKNQLFEQKTQRLPKVDWPNVHLLADWKNPVTRK